jgi:hypothetical protein
LSRCSTSRTACDLPVHQFGRDLSASSGDTAMRYTLSSCTPLPCTLLPCTALPTAGFALASALPRRRSLRGRPRQVTAVRNLVALRASRSRAATPHLHPRTPEPRASLARIALLLTRLNTPCAPLLAPGRSHPLGSCSCAHTPTPPVSAPCLLQRLFLPSSRAHPVPGPAHACSRIARARSEPQTHACTHRQLPRVTARTLAPPARRRPRSAPALLANRSSPALARSRVPPGAAGAPFHPRACLLRPPFTSARGPAAAASRPLQPRAAALRTRCMRARARARPDAAAGRSSPLAPCSTPLAWAARLPLGPRPPAARPWLCWIPSAHA